MIFLSITLLLLDSRGYLTSTLRYWVQAIVSPLQYTVNAPSVLLHKTIEAFASHNRLLDENESLNAQLILLKLQQQRFQHLKSENRQLRGLLNVSKNLPVKVSVAEVLFIAADTQGGEWVLNLGQRDGVRMGQAVLDASGILGEVVSVAPTTSRMMLVSDVRSNIPVESATTGLRSILQGNGIAQPLSLMFIPKTEHIDVGDTLISSGIDGHFPEGYPVGKVTAVDDSASQQFLSIDVAPITEINHERFVLLVEDRHD